MNRAVLWVGRGLALILTILVANDYFRGGAPDRDTRISVISIVAMVFTLLALWQIWIAWWRDGWPTFPPSFRWVMAMFFGSIVVFTVWSLLVATTDVYSRELSTLMWYQMAMSSIYFLARWINLGGPRPADIGETGTQA